MTEGSAPAPRVSVALSGNMLQFNITLLVLALLAFGLLFICSRNSDPIFMYGGSIIAVGCILAIIIFAICFYSKQKTRPLDGQTVAVTVKDKMGNELSINNPPDSFFEKGELNAVARLILVGYNENMRPSGEVIGKASEENYRLYSQEEKDDFVKHHRDEIRGKRFQARELLTSIEKTKNQSNASDSTHT